MCWIRGYTRIWVLKYFHQCPCLQTNTVHKKWDGNRSEQYTGVKSIHKASCSNVLLAPLLLSHCTSTFSIIKFLIEKHHESGGDVTQTCLCVGGIVCYAVFISVLPFLEIMLTTYWRVMPWWTLTEMTSGDENKKGEEFLIHSSCLPQKQENKK